MKLAQVAINNHFALFVANSMLSFRFLNVPFIKKKERYIRVHLLTLSSLGGKFPLCFFNSFVFPRDMPFAALAPVKTTKKETRHGICLSPRFESDSIRPNAHSRNQRPASIIQPCTSRSPRTHSVNWTTPCCCRCCFVLELELEAQLYDRMYTEMEVELVEWKRQAGCFVVLLAIGIDHLSEWSGLGIRGRASPRSISQTPPNCFTTPMVQLRRIPYSSSSV